MDVKKLCNSNSSTLPDSYSGPIEMELSPISTLPTEMLQCIMEKLPLRDLLCCREVNHYWKSAATLPARKKCAPIPFTLMIDSDQRIKILSEFNDCVREAKGEFPVSTFRFAWNWNGCDNRIKFNGHASYVSTFFESISPFVSELSLTFMLELLALYTMDITQHEYPKLKCLTLKVTSDFIFAHRNKKYKNSPLGDKSLFTFFKGVIANAPNLDNVAFKIDPYIYIRERNRLEKFLTGTGIRKNLKLLTSLSLAFDDVDWQRLTIMGLKLKALSITFTFNGDSVVDTTVMKAFLDSQANTLSSLKLDWYFGDYKVLMDFPILPQLKHLRIREHWDTGNPEKGLKFPSLSYQAQLPALKKLNLLSMNTSRSQVDLFVKYLAPLDTVEELILPDVWWGSEMFEFDVVRFFPNVKKLQLQFDEVRYELRMGLIYDNLKGVEELRLVNMGICADSIITGLGKSECENIQEPPSESFNCAVEKLQLPDAKSLACLENLKVLKIYKDNEEDDQKRNVELKEISAYVLKTMKNLKRLDFGVRKVLPFVSKALLDDLEKHGIQVTSQQPPHRRAKLCLLPRGQVRDEVEEEKENKVLESPVFSPLRSGSDDDENNVLERPLLSLPSPSGSDDQN